MFHLDGNITGIPIIFKIYPNSVAKADLPLTSAISE